MALLFSPLSHGGARIQARAKGHAATSGPWHAASGAEISSGSCWDELAALDNAGGCVLRGGGGNGLNVKPVGGDVESERAETGTTASSFFFP